MSEAVEMNNTCWPDVFGVNTKSCEDERLLKRVGLEAYLKLTNENWLHEQYVIKMRSSINIARELRVTYRDVIIQLRKYNIHVRNPSEHVHVRFVGVDRINKIDNYDWIYKEYVTNMRSCRDIGKELGLKGETVGKALTRFGIEIRGRSVYMRGDQNPCWNHGVSLIYCEKFNGKFKEFVREKFGRKCYECNKLEQFCDRKLHVHHIDYNKNAICNGKEWAFVPLCTRCHNKTHSNRHHWFNKYINYWVYKYDLDFCQFYDESLSKTRHY